MGNQKPVVLEVEQDLAVLAKVLHLALRPTHGELQAAGGGPDGEFETAMLQVDPFDRVDPPEEIPAVQRGENERPRLLGPFPKVTHNANLALLAPFITHREADVPFGLGRGKAADRPQAAVPGPVRQLDIERLQAAA